MSRCRYLWASFSDCSWVLLMPNQKSKPIDPNHDRAIVNQQICYKPIQWVKDEDLSTDSFKKAIVVS
jgi:hypothetical protein